MAKWKKWLSAATALTVLVELISVGSVDASKMGNANVKQIAKIALVPLDDRPVNTYFPEMSAKASGLEVIMPDAASLGRFTTPGDGAVIGKWLEQQVGEVDASLVSVSMLAYGGLVASRTAEQPYEKALENIQSIKKIKEKAPNKPLYVFDTIQRLAVTATNPETLKYYNQIREWAILYDEVHNLGMIEKKARLDEIEALIPPAVLQDYINARARNNKINSLLIDWVKEGYIDYLALAQDDAAPHGLHRAEREQLVAKAEKLGVSNLVNVFPGADEVGTVLVSRLALKKMDFHPSVTVKYSGVQGSVWIAPFEDTYFDINVNKHIVATGGVVSDNVEKADLVLMVNTPPSDINNAALRHTELDQFVAQIKSYIERGKKVAITDVAFTNRADPELIRRLKETMDLPQLLAYTAWGTAGNNMGSALGQALARAAFIERGNQFGVPLIAPSAQAQASLLLSSFANDYDYRNVVQAQARTYLKQLGGTNEFDLGNLYPQVNSFVDERLSSRVTDWYSNQFAGHSMVVGKRNGKTFYGKINELQDIIIVLPWPRIFEVKIAPDLLVEVN